MIGFIPACESFFLLYVVATLFQRNQSMEILVSLTTNKHVKRLIALALIFVMSAQSAFAATGDYARGMEALKVGNLQKASKFLEAVERSDSDYGEALKALEEVRKQQDRKKNQAQSKSEIEKCRKLYIASSPQAPDCVDELRLKWGNDLFATGSDTAIVDLKEREAFSKKFDDTVNAVTTVIHNPIEGPGLDAAAGHIAQLEVWSADTSLPEGYREAAKDRLGHYYLGRFDASNKACKVLWEAGKGQEETTQRICNEASRAVEDFGRVTNNLNVKAIEAGFAGRTHKTFIPVSQFQPADSLVIYDPSKAAASKKPVVIPSQEPQETQAAPKGEGQPVPQAVVSASSDNALLILAGAGVAAFVIVAAVVVMKVMSPGAAPAAVNVAPMAHAAMQAAQPVVSAAISAASAVGSSEAVAAATGRLPDLTYLNGLLTEFKSTTAPVRIGKSIIAYLEGFGLEVAFSDDKKSFAVAGAGAAAAGLKAAVDLVVKTKRHK